MDQSRSGEGPTLAAPLAVAAFENDEFEKINNFQNRRYRNWVMLSGSDQLRQRVAYALSQIFVISDNTATVSNGLEGSSSYYDMLLQNALGNFRQLLFEVTRHPMMGRFLTHYQNRKADLDTGTRADENYAREVMQLFTIGLYRLNQDGTYQSVINGRATETYTNDQITEFARVFTGFTDEDNNPNAVGTGVGRVDFPRVRPQNYTQPMKMWEPQHDTGVKALLSYPGVSKPILPAGQTGLQDINDAIDNLFEHPNTGPFIGRLLIQRLVTSNPSNGYVSRVSAAFANNGQGQRGDMLTVIKAILLDPEARNIAFLTDPEHGKLREPFLRITHLLRAFRFNPTANLPGYNLGGISSAALGQFPLSAPSVFNFYSPDYAPPGAIGDAGLMGPEFQILNTVFGITTPNSIYALLYSSRVGSFSLDLSPQAALGNNSKVLVDNIDRLLTHGTLSAETRAKVIMAIDSITNRMVPSGDTLGLTKARMAIYLIAVSPDYTVLK